MSWQDVVLAIGSLVFIFALVPTIVGPTKPHPDTCLVTGAVLLVFAAVYGTLHLWLAMGTTLITAILWFVLWQQSRHMDKETI